MTDTITAKRLIIPVRDHSEYFTDNADYMVIDLDVMLMARIRTLAATVRDPRVYKVVEFNYAGEFMTADWDAEPDNGKVALKEFEGGMECNTLNVTDSNFFWSGFYKHTDVRWETDSVPLTALDDPAVLDEREPYGKNAGNDEAPGATGEGTTP